MEFLTYRKIVHGNLAASNILLCDENVVKITNFGKSRERIENIKLKLEEVNQVPLVPIPSEFKWMALETISDQVLNQYSDVWSLGVLLWELFSLAQEPYSEIDTHENIYFKLRDGYRMAKPRYSTKDIYCIMLNCWNVNPDTRPT